jgi:hypothetical protein
MAAVFWCFSSCFCHLHPGCKLPDWSGVGATLQVAVLAANQFTGVVLEPAQNHRIHTSKVVKFMLSWGHHGTKILKIK